jgi:molecular chaperone GrpE
MKSGKRAGEPEAGRSPTGAPADPAGSTGTPPQAPDAVPRPDPSAEAEDAARVERDLDRLLTEARSERDEYLELAQRTRADFDNYRRRATQEAAEAERRAKSALARELVPGLDNLERALRAAGIDPDGDEGEAGAAGDDGGLAQGVLLVYRELRATLERAGVETYDPTGEGFDPAWHEALATRAASGTDAGIVLETVEKGYRLDGQVLRPAKVIVSE